MIYILAVAVCVLMAAQFYAFVLIGRLAYCIKGLNEIIHDFNELFSRIANNNEDEKN